MLNARYPQLTEDLEIAYALNGKGPLSRPFFSLSLNNTSRLLLALVILAQDSEEKGFEETILDKSTGTKWFFLFQRIHDNLIVCQRIVTFLYFILFQITKRLNKTTVPEQGTLPTLDEVLGRLLRIMAKEPRDRVSVTLTFTARQEKWKFLFLPISD